LLSFWRNIFTPKNLAFAGKAPVMLASGTNLGPYQLEVSGLDVRLVVVVSWKSVFAESLSAALTPDYSERSAWTVLIRAARAAGTNDAKIAEATMTAADPINGSSPGSWSAGT